MEIILEKFNEGLISRLDDDSKQLFDIRNNDKSHLLKFGMDYYINDKIRSLFIPIKTKWIVITT
jgi:hypothetical protein